MPTEQYGQQDLTELQLDLMEVLWDRGEATIAEVQDALIEERGLAMTTVATLLSRLEKRGVLTHRTNGRVYVYKPVLSRASVRESMVSALTDRLFSGDVTALMNHLLTAAEFTSEDLRTVRKMIEQKTEEPHA